MRKLNVLFYALLLLTLNCGFVAGQTSNIPAEKGILRLKLQPEVVKSISGGIKTRGGVVKTGNTALDVVNTKIKVASMKRMFPYSAKHEYRMQKYGLDLWYEVSYENNITPETAAGLYKNTEGVRAVDVVKKMVLTDGSGRAIVAPKLPQSKAPLTIPFNDPSLRRQWHYQNDGTLETAVAGSDINLYAAWEITTGNPNVIVAVIDGGIDYKHEDLADNIWINQAELNGKEGVDDDGNGYVDDVYGWNFIRKSNVVYPHDHGTHVAGTVAAVNNNGVGGAGVAGGSGNKDGVKMMSCQVFDQVDGESGSYAQALIYAANSGAVIAQCSWGWQEAGYKEQAVLDAIDYFTNEAGNYANSPMKGGLCIFATGNLGLEGDFYPAAYEPVIAVAAMGADLTVTAYSNHHSTVDITAPGGVAEFNPILGVYSTLPRNQYGFMDGTSMACPHVSGVAALILSKFGDKNFTNKELRTRLLTAVKDVYKLNPSAVGKFGEGYLDAELALRVNNKQAPATITDYALLLSQQEAGLEWVIPTDADDHFVSKHIIYWSTKAFTSASDLSLLSNKEVDTKFRISGEKILFEINGLTAETEYWFAIQAVDRWGNKSVLSPVKSGKTNAGPQVVLDKESMNLSVNVADSYEASESLSMSNVGEGLLKWTGELRTKGQTYQSYALGASRQADKGRTIAPYRGRVSGKQAQPLNIIWADYVLNDFPKTMKLYKHVEYSIGESDTLLGNSLAQYFTIDSETWPNGFNLTDIYLGGDQAKGDVLVEIYSGEKTLAAAKLLLSDTISNFTYNQDMTLMNQMYFAPKESFWLVLHTKKGNINPLGIGGETSPEVSNNCYYSSNTGRTWTPLAEVLKEGTLSKLADTVSWCISLITKNPSISGYLTLNPASGNVAPESAQTIEVSTTEQNIIDGTYNLDMILNTNETGHERRLVDLTLEVSGHKPVLITPKIVNIGDVFIGAEKTVQVEIFNSGYGLFNGEFGSVTMTSSDPQFVLPDYFDGIVGRTKKLLPIIFRPAAVGTQVATITLTEKTGIQHSFFVRGIADYPAKIEVTPATIDAGTLTYGDASVEHKVTITNTGSYPLEYVFPQYTDEVISGITKTSHKFGYSSTSNLEDPNGFTYVWDELPSAKNIASQFNDDNIWSAPIELGFKFPYYGETYDEIYVGSYGTVSFTTDAPMFGASNPPTSGDAQGLGLITAFGANRLQFDGQSKVLHAIQNGKFVVSFENAMVPTFDEGVYVRISFRIALCENGDIEMHYNSVESLKGVNSWGGPLMNTQNIFIGCTDIFVEDPFIITDLDVWEENHNNIHTLLTDGSAIQILAPGANMLKDISEKSGVVDKNSSKEISFWVAADSTMYTGDLQNIVTILSNDPANSTSYITLKANIEGDYYKPLVELGTEALDLGEIFRTATVRSAVSIKNKGQKPVEVNSVQLADNRFTLDAITLPYLLQPGTSLDASFIVPTDVEGLLTDVLTVEVANGQTLSASIAATIVGTPTITLNPVVVSETVAGGTSKNITLEITNPGNNTLEYSIIPDKLLFPATATTEAGEEVNYTYASSMSDKSVTFDWEDITATGEHFRLDYFLTKDYVAVPLPEKVTFYGQDYDTLYVFGTGFITFEKYLNAGGTWPEPPMTIPSQSNSYRTYIAPFWGVHTPDQSAYSGVYYEWKDDRIIVSFIDYANVMNTGVCFQAIITKVGSIKFQYKLLDYGQFMGLFGCAGIENFDNSKGIKLPERYVFPKLAVEFTPVKTQKIAPKGSKKVNMMLDARTLLADTYTSEVTINTNVPGNEEVKLPVSLTVTGTASPQYPSEVDLGDIIVNTMTVPFEFEVKNNGTKAFTITGFSLRNPQDDPFLPLYELRSLSGGGGGIAPGAASYNMGESIVVGKEPCKFQIAFNKSPSQEQNIEDMIQFTTDLGNVNIPLKIAIVPPPAMKITQGAMNFYANEENSVFDSTFIISNAAGLYKLKYAVSVAFSNTAVETAPTASAEPPVLGVLTAANIAPQAPSRAPKADESGEFIRELKYDTFGNPINYMGTGEEYTPFTAVTVFKAPADGFNIAAVECLATIDGVSAGDIKAEIKVGSSHLTATTIGSGTIHVADNERIYRKITLDRSVYINSGETFYLFLTFPTGVKFPLAFIATTEKGVTGRYFGLMGGEWIDLYLSEQQFGPVGFVVRCMEKEAGLPWVTIADSNDGIVEKGDSTSLTVHVNAKTARFMNGNRATITVKGTAPDNEKYSFPVTLDKNSAPLITQLGDAIEIAENDTATVNFKVVDSEGDKFTVTLEDEVGIATHEMVDNDLKVSLKTKFGHAGDQRFTLTATDAFNHKATKTVAYFVTKVNRAPIVVEPIASMKVSLGDVIETVDLQYVFTDPDGDTLRYTVASSDETIAKGFVKDGMLEFATKTKGETMITLTAIDPSGESVTTTFELAVKKRMKAGGDKKITTWPNPVIYQLNVRCAEDIEGEATIRMYDMGGNLSYMEKTTLGADIVKTIDVLSFPAGIYVLEIECKGEKMSTKVVKQ